MDTRSADGRVRQPSLEGGESDPLEGRNLALLRLQRAERVRPREA